MLTCVCCLVVVVRSEPDLDGALAFRPGDGLLKVGDSTEIECVLTGAEGDSNNYNASSGPVDRFRLVDLHAQSSLLSADVSSLPVRVKPPLGYTTYPNSGSTVIQCSYAIADGLQLEKNLTVRVLRESSISVAFSVFVRVYNMSSCGVLNIAGSCACVRACVCA